MPISEVFNEDNMTGMAQYPDKFFDLAIVDPPYGIGAFWNKQIHTSHYGKKNWNNKIPKRKYFKELLRISKDQIIWGGNYFTRHLPPTNSWIVWEKGNRVEKMNTSECEVAWTSFNIPMRKVFIQWSGGRKGNETGVANIHPTQRPLKLYSWLLNNYAKPGCKIIDTHMGSQSSRIAAYQMGFDYYGWEIDKGYFEAGNKRFKEQTAQQQLFT
jgi:site-specific DNA-methyltransferase (adenine-specific)